MAYCVPVDCSEHYWLIVCRLSDHFEGIDQFFTAVVVLGPDVTDFFESLFVGGLRSTARDGREVLLASKLNLPLDSAAGLDRSSSLTTRKETFCLYSVAREMKVDLSEAAEINVDFISGDLALGEIDSELFASIEGHFD